MLPKTPVIFTLITLNLRGPHCTENIYVNTFHDSKPMKTFTESLYEIWGTPFVPVDLSQLNNFDGSEWIISITNFMNSDIIGVAQPFVIRKPIPAVFKHENETGTPIFLGWILENTAVNRVVSNSSWYAYKVLSDYCFGHGSCAMLDFRKLTLKSKMWNNQIRADLFPPNLITSRLHQEIEELSKHYKNLLNYVWEFSFPFLWEVGPTRSSLLNRVLVGKIPLLHFLLIPQGAWKLAIKSQVLTAWADNTEYTQVSMSTNTHFFLVELVDNYGCNFSGKIYYVDRYHSLEIIETKLKILEPGWIFEILEQIFIQIQMHVEINTGVEEIKTYFEMCRDQSAYLFGETETTISADKIMYHALAQVWQSILKNYTYTSDNIVCSNGGNVDINTTVSHSWLLIGTVYLLRFLHVPMQILNPISGSYRFVVCGIKGSEEMAFGELNNAYDKYVWGTLILVLCGVALVWKLLVSVYINLYNKNLAHNLQRSTFPGKLYSLLKILLEQGELTPDSASLSNQKVKIFLGIVLTMCIVLSNGYKNVNVYKMVSPRQPLRYEQFSDLIDYNFTIYTFSKLDSLYWGGMNVANWFSQNISVSRLSRHTNVYHLCINKSKYGLLKFKTILKDIIDESRFDMPSPYLNVKGDIEFNRMVHYNTHIFPANILAMWIEQFRKRYANWENITVHFTSRFNFLVEFLRSEFLNFERKLLVSLLNHCNKTALVLPSNEAESYAKLLTPKRGNAGREIYFQQYLVVQVGGMVTPPFLTRLARMKESGILEWWRNITEYVSLVQFQGSASGVSLMKENHPAGASVKGNIVVIFTLLLGCLAVATIGFVVEIAFSMMLCAKQIISESYFISLIY